MVINAKMRKTSKVRGFSLFRSPKTHNDKRLDSPRNRPIGSPIFNFISGLGFSFVYSVLFSVPVYIFRNGTIIGKIISIVGIILMIFLAGKIIDHKAMNIGFIAGITLLTFLTIVNSGLFF